MKNSLNSRLYKPKTIFVVADTRIWLQEYKLFHNEFWSHKERTLCTQYTCYSKLRVLHTVLLRFSMFPEALFITD
jgi:hypothetical protein